MLIKGGLQLILNPFLANENLLFCLSPFPLSSHNLQPNITQLLQLLVKKNKEKKK